MNSEIGYNQVGMFNQSTLNIPAILQGSQIAGVYEVARAKYTTQALFLVQKLYIDTHDTVYIRINWNNRWSDWKGFKYIA